MAPYCRSRPSQRSQELEGTLTVFVYPLVKPDWIRLFVITLVIGPLQPVVLEWSHWLACTQEPLREEKVSISACHQVKVTRGLAKLSPPSQLTLPTVQRSGRWEWGRGGVNVSSTLLMRKLGDWRPVYSCSTQPVKWQSPGEVVRALSYHHPLL